jgi:hypothetical protein
MTDRRELGLALVVVATVALAAIFSNLATLPDRIALGGVSPIDWVNHLTLPENFRNDFQSGIEIYHHSLFMRLYSTLSLGLGLDTEFVMRAVVVLEVVALAAAAAYLTYSLLPSASPVVPAVTALIIVASSLGLADLSRIAVKPYFAGLYYNAADAARLCAIALALHRRWGLAVATLAFSTATHPIMGGLGAFFVAIMVFFRAEALRDRRLPIAVAAYLILVGFWVLGGVAQTAQLSGGKVPREIWLDYTTALSSHWYPYAYGMLTDFHGQHLLPLLGYCVLFYRYLPELRLPVEIERAWRWGVSGLFALTAAGIAFSVWLPEPFLIKLNLQRASALILWVGLPIVMAGLIQDVLHAHWLKRVAAGVLLLSPFLSGAVVPTAAVLILTAPSALNTVRRWSQGSIGRKISCATFFSVVIVLTWYVVASGYFSANKIYYAGAPIAWKGGVLLAVSVWGIKRFWNRVQPEILILAFVALAAVNWIKEDYRAASANHERAAAYREVQEWARLRTAPEALFSVDPLILYGWRDYSQRSSFGNLREWLHTSWLYDSNPTYFHEGMKRFGELGIDPSPYLKLRPTSEKMSAFYTAVGQRFYEVDDGWRMDLAKRYGISFFVMERAKLKPTSMPRVFENDFYVVLDARVRGG